ncbi:MAG: cation:proton antiporter [Ignavibacteriae bacterium]|nr:cation:proton antiporter [Ignavibacteriota bacterium]
MSLLFDIITLLSLAILIILIASKFNIPVLIGFLFTGILIGPSAFSLVSNISDIEILAEVGIILLMFTIGLEFSLEKINQLKKDFILFGGLQVLLTWIVLGIICFSFGLNISQSIFIGFAISLSSTAILLKYLKDSDKLNTPSGIKIIGILLFQDAALIPFLILLPALTTTSEFSTSIIYNILISIGSITILLIASKFFIPKLFNLILNLRLAELFIVTIFVIIFGISFAAYKLGASLAMGAFIAGLSISDTEHAHHVNTELIPSRNLFNSIFFISIGMFVDISFFKNNFIEIIASMSVLILIKGIILLAIFYFLKNTISNGIITALSLAHIGEFSFILLRLSNQNNLFSDYIYQLLISASVLSMFFIPLLIKIGDNLSSKSNLKTKLNDSDKTENIKLKNHTIIAGFGVNGKNISNVLKLIGIPFIIIEANPKTVRKYRKLNYPIYFGELDRKENLDSMGIINAALLVIAISDIEATQRAIKIAKSINPNIKLIVRANYVTQVEEMYKLGADLVISQDLETSLVFLNHILDYYNLPRNITRLQTNLLKKEHYKFFTSHNKNYEWNIFESDIIQKDNEMFFISSSSKLISKNILEFEPVKNDVIKIIGIVRDNKIVADNLEFEKVQKFDTLILSGNHRNLETALNWFEANN